MATAKEISADATIGDVLSQPDGTFALEVEQNMARKAFFFPVDNIVPLCA